MSSSRAPIAGVVAAVALLAVTGWWLLGRDPAPTGALPGRAEPVAATGDRRAEEASSASEATEEATPDVRREPGSRSTERTGSRRVERCALHGHIVGPSWVPVARGRISLTPLNPASNAEASSRSITLDGKGYAFANLRPDLYRLMVSSDGHRPLDEILEIPATAKVHLLNLKLAPSLQLPVRLRHESGEPLLKALADHSSYGEGMRHFAVIATPDDPGEGMPMGTTANSQRLSFGRYHSKPTRPGGRSAPVEIPDSADGVIEVDIEPPLFVSLLLKHRVLDTARVTEETAEVELTAFETDLQLATVTVRFVDGVTGDPAVGRVSLSDSQSGWGGKALEADGSVTVDSVLPGLLRMTANLADLAEYRRIVRIDGGGPLDLGTIRVPPARTLTGVLRDPDGHPVKGGIWYRHLHELDEAQGLDLHSTFITDSSGRFQIRAVGGTLLVYPRSKDVACNPTVIDLSGETAEVDVLQQHGTPVILHAGLSAVEQATATIADSRGIPAWARRIGGWSYDLRLRPGSYTLELEADSGELWKREFAVGTAPVNLVFDAHEPTLPRRAGPIRQIEDLHVELPGHLALDTVVGESDAEARDSGAGAEAESPPSPTALVLGRVSGPDGEDVPGVQLALKGSAGPDQTARTQGRTGAYSFVAVGPGRYTLTARVKGYRHHEEALVVAPGAELIQRDVGLRPAARVKIEIVDDEGVPLVKLMASEGPFSRRSLRKLQVFAMQEAPAPGQRPTAELGRFAPLDSFGEDGLEIQGDPPLVLALVYEERILESRTLTTVPDTVRFVVSAAELQKDQAHVTVLVTDAESGEPLRPEKLWLTDANTWFTPSENQTYEEDGSLTLETTPGEKRLHATHPGYFAIRAGFDAAAGEAVDLGRLAMKREASAEVRFIDAVGVPAPVTFDLIDREPGLGERLSRDDSRHTTDLNGIAPLSCARSRYQLRLTADQWAREILEVDLSTGRTEPFVFTVQPGTPLEFSTERDTTVRARVLDARGDEVASVRLSASAKTRTVRLVPGAYWVEWRAYDSEARAYSEPETREVSVGSTPTATGW